MAGESAGGLLGQADRISRQQKGLALFIKTLHRIVRPHFLEQGAVSRSQARIVA